MNLFFLDQGPRTALPIVFIHGFPFDHTMWAPQVQALKNDFRLITYDVRGLGRSPLSTTPATMESYVDDLFALIDYLHLSAPALCGLSMGGYIALRAAEREPHRARALILADTRSEADAEPVRQNRLAMIRVVEKDGLKPLADDFINRAFAPCTIAQNKPCVASIHETILHHDPKGVCAAIAAVMSRTDTTPSLAKIKIPTLVLGGDNDTFTPPATCQALASAIPGAKFALIPNAGHLSSLENSQDFNRHLLGFLHSLTH
jgi:3-oxoadipate enol-lactonase